VPLALPVLFVEFANPYVMRRGQNQLAHDNTLRKTKSGGDRKLLARRALAKPVAPWQLRKKLAVDPIQKESYALILV
jgi:hypothetical protein